jgi:hypothetical protein
MESRPAIATTRWTRLVLNLGTLAAGVLLAAGLLLRLVGGSPEPWLTLGVLVMLATPAAGLVAAAAELRQRHPRVALLALMVLAVLGMAVLVALH